MLFNKKKENLKDFKALTNLLKERILNRKILEDILNKLYYGERTNKIISIGLDGATIYDKKSGDKFVLRITEDCIATDYVCWNGHHHEVKTLTFDGDLIVIDYQESTNYIMGSTKQPCGTERKAWTEVYKNNDLSYKREFETQTDSDLTRFLSSSVTRETFINENHEAVVIEVSSGDYDAFTQSGICYSKADFLDLPPYDTVHCDRSCYVNRFRNISEEEFRNFFGTMNKTNYYPILRKR